MRKFISRKQLKSIVNPITFSQRLYSQKIDIGTIKQLRVETDAPLGQCKKALQSSNGNIEEAKVWLQKQGLATAKKKSSRETAEGFLGFKVSPERATIVEVNCETDFSAGTNSFKTLVSEIAEHINKDSYNSVDELLESEMNGQRVADRLVQTTQKIGENITIGRLSQFTPENGSFYGYIHNKVGDNAGEIVSLMELEGCEDEKFGIQLAMHAAAMQPLYVREEDIPNEKMQVYRSIVEEQMENLRDKPNFEKIMEGKLKKQLQDDVLLYQKWIYDDKTPVQKILKNNNVNVIRCIRWKAGEEHVKKEKPSFEDEVKQQLGSL